MSIDFRRLKQRFAQMFPQGPAAAGEARVYAAPGRVNLIGEHTDYNDGFVLPLAIDREVAVAVRPRKDRTVRVRSLNVGKASEFSLDGIQKDAVETWSNYTRGVALYLLERFPGMRGADILLESDVPIGAGLSSSAALEMASALALLGANGLEMDRRQMALVCQRAENEFVGARCGIMDQLASAFGEAGKALLIDCRDLSIQPAPLPAGLKVVVCDTMKRRTIGGSEYNVRRAQCEEAVALLKPVMPGIKALRDVSPADFERHKSLLPQPARDRAEHVVYEDQRTLDAVAALRAGHLATTGRLMAESHASLRDKFRVSCPELDAMVEVAAKSPACVGTRMTGGGFGGCTVSLVRAEGVDAFRCHVEEAYRARTGVQPMVYVTQASAGAGAR